MRGERLSELVCLERAKLAAGIVLLSPFVPLLFMGEEYGETAPFPYFISHSDQGLIEAVRRGRRDEFAAFGWAHEPPDPQDESTFLQAKLNHDQRHEGYYRVLLEFHRELIRLRKDIPALAHLSKDDMEVFDYEREKVLVIRRRNGPDEAVGIFHFDDESAARSISLPGGQWAKRLDSADTCWQGPGSQIPAKIISDGEMALTLSPYSFVLFVKE